jgi:hypothetical protein
MASAMELLSLMTEQNGGATPTGGGAPPIPVARRAARTGDAGSGRASAGRGRDATSRSSWRGRGWDIPWLGGRSTAPWVVLATVLILVVAAVGALYAKSRPDRLGYNATTVAIRSDSAVDLTFSVYKAPNAVAACDVVAADPQGEVGSLHDVPIPARSDGSENTALTVSVPTTRRAGTAVLQSCRIVKAG